MMSKRTKFISSTKDEERLRKRYSKLVDEAYAELNEISGLDPKYKIRSEVHEALRRILCVLIGTNPD